jgi:alpha-L-rhamnosidase
LLNQIWQVGVDSLRLNMTDGYTDTPWRERGQWWGDAFIEHRINLAVFGDNSLYERGVLLMANNGPSGEIYGMAPNGAGLPMLDYGMLWVQSLHYLATIEENCL